MKCLSFFCNFPLSSYKICVSFILLQSFEDFDVQMKIKCQVRWYNVIYVIFSKVVGADSFLHFFIDDCHIMQKKKFYVERKSKQKIKMEEWIFKIQFLYGIHVRTKFNLHYLLCAVGQYIQGDSKIMGGGGRENSWIKFSLRYLTTPNHSKLYL